MIRMNSRVVFLLILTFSFAISAGCVGQKHSAPLTDFPTPCSYHTQAQKIRVIDGDTFVINGEKIRVIGVDAFEYKHPQKRYVIEKLGISNISCMDFYGERAYLFAEEVLKSHRVSVKPVKKDRYGRTLAYVFVCNATNCADYGTLLLERGLAIVYDYEEFEKKSEYKEIQRRAQLERAGLWSCE